MRVHQAISTGFSRAVTSVGLVALLWVTTLAAALPFALVVRDAIERSVGPSRVHLDLEERFDMDWYSEYAHESVGIERLLTPTSVRPAAFLDNLEAWFSGELFLTRPEIVALGVAFALGWILLSGGIFWRFAYRENELSLRTFFGRGAELFPRFARLAAITGIAYFLVYRFSRWLFPQLDELMRDVTVERTALAVHLAGAVLVVFLLVLIKLVSDYAKASVVLDDRRGMLAAAWHATRFVATHPLRTFGAYASIAAIGFLLLAFYSLVSPGHSQAGSLGVVWVFLLSQAFLAVRIVQRLTVCATTVEIYRSTDR